MRGLNRKKEAIGRNCEIAFLSFEVARNLSKYKSRGENHTNINISNLTLFKYVHTKKITINNIDKSLLDTLVVGTDEGCALKRFSNDG